MSYYGRNKNVWYEYIIMEKLLELVSKRKWVKHCLRLNVAQPEDIKMSGSIKAAKIYSNVLNKREKELELYDAIREVVPEWWGDETQITLNKGLVCKRHKDHGNKEHSYILWLGDFTGGALNFDDGTKVGGKGVWHKIKGHVHHWNDPHEGSKYSIVLYRGTRKQKKQITGRGYAGKAGCSKSPNSSSVRASGTLCNSRVRYRRRADNR